MNASVFSFIIFIILFVLCLIIVRYKSADPGEFDERQLLVRGSAYRWGFIVTMLFVLGAVLAGYTDNIFITRLMTLFAFFGGLLVYMVYSIWNGAFFHLHQNPVRYLAVCIFIAGVNAVTTVSRLLEGETFSDILTTRPSLNLMMALLFAAAAVTILLRMAADRREEA